MPLGRSSKVPCKGALGSSGYSDREGDGQSVETAEKGTAASVGCPEEPRCSHTEAGVPESPTISATMATFLLLKFLAFLIRFYQDEVELSKQGSVPGQSGLGSTTKGPGE